MDYSKPPLSLDDQIELLAQRGMGFSDRARVRHCLSHINYYRIRGYWLPFEEPARNGEHRFRNGTRFRSVENFHRCLDALQEEVDRSHETFIEHYRRNYERPKLPPIWAACEVMTLGQLSRWMGILHIGAIDR